VRDEWARRVEAEYRSAAISQHLTLWLIQIGASPDLITDGLQVVADELVHARMSFDVYAAAGGQGAPRLVREELGLLRHHATLERDVLDIGVRVFCLGETVAVPLFQHLRARCTVPVARAALDRILRDEVRHREFGWSLLDWLLATQDPAEVRALAHTWLPAMFGELERSYGERDDLDERGATDPASADDARAWGLAPAVEYAEVLQRTFMRDYAPRFDARGIDPRPAWAARRSSAARQLRLR
jgi:hypothetical protein